MSDIPTLRFRQVHLDFHTSPHIPDVGRDFDPDVFGEALTAARVDSVTCFAKCHHGMSYYNTSVGVRHPALTFDLLGAQIEACHKRDIRAPIYLTCVWDNHMAEQHPDWQQRTRDGKTVGAQPGEAGWRWICLNSPYLDYQDEQTKELLGLYDVDGIFYDIVFQNDPGCWCPACQASMKVADLNPDSDDDQRKHSQLVIDRFMERLSTTIRSRKPDATIFYNGRVRQGMGAEARWMSHAEIEALPTGGWGYGYFPFWVRYARHFGLPTMGMTGRFHRSWADFGGLKSESALKFECGGMLANGAVCSIGDQLHPRGALDPAVYDVIGETYRDIESREPWCADAVPVTEVALVLVERANHKTIRNDSDEGAVKALLELHQQFDVLDADADWSGYRAVIVADRGRPSPELTERMRAYVKGGGRLLLSHQALLDPETNEFALSELMGVDYAAPNPAEPSFFRLRPNFRHGLRDFEWVMMCPSSNVTPGPTTDVLADVYGSYFNRSGEMFTSHSYSPRTDPTGFPAVTWFGGVAYIYSAVFQAFQSQGDTVYRRVVGNALDLLIPDPLVTTNAPPTTEVTVTKQGPRYIVHLVSYHANRRGAHIEVIEHMPPIASVRIGLRLPVRPRAVYTAPDRLELDVDYYERRANVVIPEIGEHAMIVFECD